MSRAVFSHESPSGSKTTSSPAAVRVNRPGDAYEIEADHVADSIDRGERVSGWSFSTASLGRVQRQPTPDPQTQQPPKPLTTGDMAGKVAEAVLATKEGKAAVEAIKQDKLVKATTDFLQTPAGIIISGSAAVGVISGLAAAHQPLPLQVPKIPLDFVHPGLGVKIDYQGPVNHPSSAMVTLSFTPKGPEKKKKDEGAAYRAETARMAAGLQVFEDKSQDTQGLGPVAKPGMTFAEKWALSHMPDYAKYNPAAPGKPDVITGADPSAMKWRPPADAPLAAQKDAAKKTETHSPADAKKDEKREELPVQRKAESCFDEDVPVAHDVEQAVSGSGRPLDVETKRYMESRIGFDFGKVRVFTDDQAATSARNLKARAYTFESKIVFAKGMYAPHTAAGRKLLAHELTHVVQQSPSAARKPAGISAAPPKIRRKEDDEPSLFSDPKGWALAKIRKIPGYDLFCTIIGKDLATWTDKPSKKEDILHEILKLVHGEEAWERITAVASAIGKAWEWVSGELSARHLTLADFKGLVDQAIDSIHVGDLTDIGAAIDRIKGIFKPAYDSAIDLAKKAFDKLFQIAVQAVMDNFGDLGRQVMGFLTKVGSTFMAIAKDPIKFIGNLVGALKQGFSQFADHFLTHLKDALMDFLFGEIGARIKPPKEFSIPAIFNLILDVLELNYAKFRERLVAKTSPEAVTFLEGTFDFIMKIVQAKSLAAAWDIFKDKALSLINELVNSAIDTIKNWVLTKIVQAAIKKVLELFTPASAIVAAIEAIYHTIVTLIEKGKQLLAILNAVVDSISKIVAGDLTQAADFIEGAMAKAFNFLVAFLAEQAGIGGIGKTIREFITGVKDKVWGVIDKVLDWVVEKSKNLWARAKATAGKVLEWWQQRKDLLIGEEEHSIYMEGSEDAPKLMIASTPGVPWSDYLKAKAKLMPANTPKKKKDLLTATQKLAEDLEKPLGKSTDDNEKKKKVEDKRKLFNQVADNLVALGFSGDALAPASIIKYDPPRSSDGGATKMTASILSWNHPDGTTVQDDAPIWTNLKKLQKQEGKTYIQGHLLNRNLGGEGRRFNLTPITNSANQKHLNIVEKTLKTMVNKKKGGSVIRYTVTPVYPRKGENAHPISKRYQTLLDMPEQDLKPKQQEEKAMYDAEQQLCKRFDFEAWELKRKDDGSWVDDKKVQTDDDHVDNNPV